MKWPLIALVVVGLGAAAASAVHWSYFKHSAADAALQDPKPAARFRYATVSRRNIVRFVTAAGRLDAVTTVKVSSQLSGQVAALLVDFNDKVKAGQPLARLDDKTFRAKVAEAQARLDNAEAALRQAKADRRGAQVRYQDAQRQLARKEKLRGRGVLSEREMESASAKVAEAKSALASAEAKCQVRTTEIRIARTLLRQAKIDLDRTVIRAPIDGVVIERNVNLGQTVAASLQAPTLFTIAKNLSRMEVDTFVDEADIGLVRKGQRVAFRVDAFPGRYFQGRVTSIRKAPKLIQNVTTYTVVVSAANPKQILLPGMTATTRIIVAARRNVLSVPNAALSFAPKGRKPVGRHGRRTGLRRVWRLDGDRLEPVAIKVGVRDDTHAELIGGAIRAGDRVAIGSLPPASREAGLWQQIFGD